MKVAMLNNCSFTLAQPLEAGDETVYLSGYSAALHAGIEWLSAFLTLATDGAPVIEGCIADGNDTAGTCSFPLQRYGHLSFGTTYAWSGATVPAGTTVEMRVTAEMIARAANKFDDLAAQYSILIANETPSSMDAAATGWVAIGDGVSPATHSVIVGGFGGAGKNGVAIGSGATCAADGVVIGRSATASAADSVVVGRGASASASGSTVLGKSAVASGVNAIAFGKGCQANADYNVAIGYTAQTNAAGTVAIGNAPIVSGENSVAIGTRAYTYAPSGVAIGNEAGASSPDAIGIGTNATANPPYSLAVGRGANPFTSCHFDMRGLFCLAAAASDGTDLGNGDKLVRHRAVPCSAISSQLINLGAVAGAVQVDLPSGMRLYIDRIDVIQTAASSATTTPQISIGTSITEKTSILAATDVTVAAQYARQSFTPLTAAGVASVYIDVPTAANAARNVRVVFVGYLAA